MAGRLETIKNSRVFARAYRSRVCFVSPFIVTYVLRRRSGGVCVGITASKKVGCAVERNRARRIVRAAAAELLRGVGASFDVVVVCRKALLSKKSTFVKELLGRHLEKAGVLR
jgi:ribonuclease P protein component